MKENVLVKIFEHNNWANQRMIETCLALSDDQLDAQPHSATKGTIRETLVHLVRAQRNYLATLTLPVEARPTTEIAFGQLVAIARASGEGLLALAGGESGTALDKPIQTRDRYLVKPWVILLQAINHATEHREQINSMLTALGLPPLELDGWSYGELTRALIPMSEE